MILEPCCYHKQLNELINGNAVTEHLFTFGDTDLQMLMDTLVHHAPGCDVYLVMIQVAPETIRTIAKLMEVRNASTDQWLVNSFVLLSQGHQRKEIAEALGKYREGGRLIVCEDIVAFRCLCVGNGARHFVLQGSIPQTVGYAMQMMTLTQSREHYDQVMRILNYKKKKK